MLVLAVVYISRSLGDFFAKSIELRLILETTKSDTAIFELDV